MRDIIQTEPTWKSNGDHNLLRSGKYLEKVIRKSICHMYSKIIQYPPPGPAQGEAFAHQTSGALGLNISTRGLWTNDRVRVRRLLPFFSHTTLGHLQVWVILCLW